MATDFVPYESFVPKVEAGVAEGGVQVDELLPGPAVHVRIPRRHLVLPEWKQPVLRDHGVLDAIADQRIQE